ncbi:hypothetical protein KKE34_05545 [Patescibacteria group bacterium]|nr:hypothetical protein [Patescibacteria group bacterium]MBU1886035.1 hypothetical protein [Patescibacteria group bacterium]
MDKKARFLKIYANLPLHLRSEIVIMVDGEPFTWQSAKLEIDNDSDTGSSILDKLAKMEIIQDEKK